MMSDNKKLWKVTVTVAQSDCEGKCEIGRETLSQIFDDFRQAEVFAHTGFKWDPWHKVLKSSIMEYDATNERELNLVKRQVEYMATKNTETWE